MHLLDVKKKKHAQLDGPSNRRYFCSQHESFWMVWLFSRNRAHNNLSAHDISGDGALKSKPTEIEFARPETLSCSPQQLSMGPYGTRAFSQRQKSSEPRERKGGWKAYSEGREAAVGRPPGNPVLPFPGTWCGLCLLPGHTAPPCPGWGQPEP